MKDYVSNSYYHLYNRGVEKRTIFTDDKDYGTFLSYMKTYLSPKDEDLLLEQLADKDIPWVVKDKVLKELKLNNFVDEIDLLAYCLMPNHYHLLVKQNTKEGIDKFMNSLCTRYTMYFNKRHSRVGPLYQGRYKAVLVESEEQLLYLSKYIHRNPAKEFLQGMALQNLLSRPSSLRDYLGITNTSWLNKDVILSYFSRTKMGLKYEDFIVGGDFTSRIISELLLEG